MQVGYLYNCSMRTNPMVRLSPTVVNRVMLVDAVLRQQGSRIFFYSPKHIQSLNEKIPGYLIEGNAFVPAMSYIPFVNGNWTYSTRRLLNKGMGYRRFVEWAEVNKVGIYAPLSLSELVVNKLETYTLVKGFRSDLHPHTEAYKQSSKQLELFLEQSNLVFLKHRAGNKGDGIVSLRRDPERFTVKFFKAGRQKIIVVKKFQAVVDFIAEVTNHSRKYVIQKGVDTIRHQASVFDLRVVMLYNGRDWNWLHEARYSPAGSDLSNISQGGISLVTEVLLFELFGNDGGNKVLNELRSEAFGLAGFLDRIYPGDVMEVAFDFILDKNLSLHLVEINTKPGLVSVGFDTNFFEMEAGQQPLFDRWVYPHTDSLAQFLLSKIHSH